MMVKYPAEIYGFQVESSSKKANMSRSKHWCPFVDQICNKKSRMVSVPFGVCSVQYQNQTIALCPRRFLQQNIVFENVADHYFSTRNNLLLFEEIGLPETGTLDYVMVKHKPLSNEIEDFAIIEFQTGQTTGTGKLVDAFNDFFQGKEIVGAKYGFGLNLADIWKRTFTQILLKGLVMERWGHKIYWVVQEPVYKNFTNRYNLNGIGYRSQDKIIFMIYDIEKHKNKNLMKLTRIESSTTDILFDAFKNKPTFPSKKDFIKKLEEKIKSELQLNLKIK